jgi:hypothetical protein
MMQAIHLFKKDLRRFWPGIVVLLGFLVFLVWHLWKDPLAANPTGPIHVNAEWEYENLWLLMVIMFLKLEDPRVGKSFWLTRPISKKSLYASKFVFVSLFGFVAPMAANFIVLVHYGLDLQYIIPCLLDSIFPFLALVFFLAAIAVLTPNMPYFFMICANGIVLLVLTLYIFLKPSSMSALSGLAIVLSLIVIFLQYLTRRTVLLAVVFVVGILMIPFVSRWINWDIVEVYKAMVNSHDPEVHNLSVAFQRRIDCSFTSNKDMDTVGKRTILGRLDISNIQPASSVEFLRLKGVLTFEDGSRLWLDNREGLASNDPGNGETVHLSNLFQVDEDVFKRFGDRLGTYSAEATLRLIRHTTEGRIPVKPGVSFKKGSQFLSVSQVSLSPDVFLLGVRGRYVEWGEGSRQLPTPIQDWYTHPMQWDRRSSDIIRPLLLAPSLHYFFYFWEASQAVQKAGGAPLIDAAYISRMELLIRNNTPTGPFTKKIKANNFRMADYTLDAWHKRSNETLRRKSVDSQKDAGLRP